MKDVTDPDGTWVERLIDRIHGSGICNDLERDLIDALCSLQGRAKDAIEERERQMKILAAQKAELFRLRSLVRHALAERDAANKWASRAEAECENRRRVQAAPGDRDFIAVDAFATAMKSRLTQVQDNHGRDWRDADVYPSEMLACLLVEHLSGGGEGTFEDIAITAMMLHQRGEDPKHLADATAALTGGAFEAAASRYEMLWDECDKAGLCLPDFAGEFRTMIPADASQAIKRIKRAERAAGRAEVALGGEHA